MLFDRGGRSPRRPLPPGVSSPITRWAARLSGVSKVALRHSSGRRATTLTTRSCTLRLPGPATIVRTGEDWCGKRACGGTMSDPSPPGGPFRSPDPDEPRHHDADPARQGLTAPTPTARRRVLRTRPGARRKAAGSPPARRGRTGAHRRRRRVWAGVHRRRRRAGASRRKAAGVRRRHRRRPGSRRRRRRPGRAAPTAGDLGRIAGGSAAPAVVAWRLSPATPIFATRGQLVAGRHRGVPRRGDQPGLLAVTTPARLLRASAAGSGATRLRQSALRRSAAAPARRTGSGSSGSGSSTDVSSIASTVDPALVDINVTLGYQSASRRPPRASCSRPRASCSPTTTWSPARPASAPPTWATDETYSATVLGYDRSHDIALIQLNGASGLKTAQLGDSSKAHGRPGGGRPGQRRRRRRHAQRGRRLSSWRSISRSRRATRAPAPRSSSPA